MPRDSMSARYRAYCCSRSELERGPCYSLNGDVEAAVSEWMQQPQAVVGAVLAAIAVVVVVVVVAADTGADDYATPGAWVTCIQ